jgi:ABC-type transport system involved in multi-copper enzyme maturation permease subunit
MGGISPERLLMSFVITLSTMVSVATLGMAISVTAPRVRDAIGRIYVILFALLVLPTIVVQTFLSTMQFSLRGSQPWWVDLVREVNRPLVDANPLATLFAAVVRPPYGSTIWTDRWEPVFTMVGYQAVFSALMAAFALWGVRRIHLASVSKVPSKWRFRLRLLPRRGIGNFPMIWKESRASESGGNWGIAGQIAVVLIVGVILAFVVWTFFTEQFNEFQGMAVAMSTLLACGGLLMTGARAACSITGERERDTWVTLLSTPIESNEIISSKIIGSIWAYRSGVMALAMIWILQIIHDPYAVLGVVLMAGTLAVLLVFASSLGTLYSLSLRNSARSIGATLGTMLAIGGGYMMCCGPVMMIGRGGEFIISACVPFLLAFPGGAIVRAPNEPPGEMVVAYIFGTFCYAIGGFFLRQVAMSNLVRGGTTDGLATARHSTSSGQRTASGEQQATGEAT